MRVLGMDTATALTAVALRDVEPGDHAGAACARAQVDLARTDVPAQGARPNHASRLLALIDELMREADVDWSGIDRIAVGVGPGTFTGLRIGLATAQGLAASAGKPLVGVSTLSALALAAHDHAFGQGETPAARGDGEARATLAVIDARRGEVFVAGWSAGQGPLSTNQAPALTPRVMRPDQLPRLIQASGTPTIAIGDGALRFAEQLIAAGAILPPANSPLHAVSAREHCRLGALAQPTPDNSVQPEYLRIPDAELAK